MTIQEQQPAPVFSEVDQNGQAISLKDFRGSWLLLYFYPKANTPGCTIEACSFRDGYAVLQKSGLQIVGVSADPVKKQLAFSQKYHLPFRLVADTQKRAQKLYGADGILFPKRVSFLIDPEGVVRKVYSNVNVQTHAGQVLADLAQMQ